MLQSTMYIMGAAFGISYVLAEYLAVILDGRELFEVSFVFGSIFSVIMAILWCKPTSQISPHLHPEISKKELEFIKQSPGLLHTYILI